MPKYFLCVFLRYIIGLTAKDFNYNKIKILFLLNILDHLFEIGVYSDLL